MIGDKIALWLLRAITALAIALTALMFSGSACAGTLGLHIGSQHFPAQDYNNFNPGAYYIHDNGATVGTYYNSERRQSVYAGWTWDSGPWRLQVGAITGYERRAVLPLIAPSVALGHGFRLTVLPKVERNGSSVVHLMYEMKL